MKTTPSIPFFPLLVLSFLYGSFGYSQSIQNDEIPKGRLEKFEFSDSEIFPGTEREVTVYIPSQIDPAVPACVYVQQDGFDPKSHFNDILDTLIQTKEIPVTVGVFVRPGYLPPAVEGQVGRPNRCFEYDGVGDNYLRFLLEEILPLVADKYGLNLSENGNDRCIGGCSSGGIAAFNAAWERPDAFSRVYCISGSFVAFRGGHEFPTLIRKTEPKPIRTFLTTATRDMENCAGDWYLLDQEMEKALKFSGYEYQFHQLEGWHCMGFQEFFRDGMRYLWKGWPSPVDVGSGAPRVMDIIEPGAPWQLVDKGYTDIRSPVCNEKGEIFFADQEHSTIYKIDPGNQISVFSKNNNHSNSLAIGASGELYAGSSISGKIIRYDARGKGSVLIKGVPARYMLAGPGGSLYVSTLDSDGTDGKVWFIKDGKKSEADPEIKFPSGIAMTPDRWLLAVASSESHWVYSYEIATDGTLKNRARFFWLHVNDWEDHSGAESICYDLEGHLYVATRMGIQICTWDGPTQVILPVPGGERVTGVCIGGAEFNTLYAFCEEKLYKRKIKNHTLGAYTPITNMTPGKL